MMIKFSWKKINDKLNWNAPSVLEYFFIKREIDIPHYLQRKVPKNVILAANEPYIKGPCFILNIDAVLKGATAPNELHMYLELASKRNIFDYHIRGVKHLPLVMVEKYMVEWVGLNPLLEIENNNIYFKYEQEKQNDN